VMASPTPKPVQKVPKITQPTKTFDFWWKGEVFLKWFKTT
jgi:hypothetical protein